MPNQRWRIAPAKTGLAKKLALSNRLSPLLAQFLINRGIETQEEANIYLNPESQVMPPPIEEFPDLAISVDILKGAIANCEKIAICGDYDADGMTSTALLLRALRWLGADVDYAIPSRMKDGYGINKRIVEEFANEGVGLILTVDNGISAHEAVSRAVELGMTIIITDHHDLPPQLPEADAILNPKQIPESSPYQGLAGVGVAYVLAIALAQEMGKIKGLTTQLLELFTLGTIADLAPLIGINRRWLKRGLKLLPKSELTGVQALIQISGVSEEQKELKPDDIGFKLGPRINAVGRLADPQIVIELLTTTDPGIALERAMECEEINHTRQQLCEEIEKNAIALIEDTPINWQEQRVLVIVEQEWHHGVIGIVASRLVERYGVPVFIGTYEGEDLQHIRGSARGIPEFHVFEALQFCHDLLEKYGGHKAAGGFSLPSENLSKFQESLSKFAHQCLETEHLKPLIEIDVEANFSQINSHLYQQIDTIHPCGIGNPDPIFWTPNVRVVDQKLVGNRHLKLTLSQDNQPNQIQAIAWRWGEYFPIPSRVDIAYKLRENNWNGNINVELELVGIRPSSAAPLPPKKAEFYYNNRRYTCSLWESLDELRIKNPEGKVLAIQKGQKIGLLGFSREDAQEIDVTKSPYFQLIKAATSALKA
ncbi:MAG TPA: single-stranded-DNA-specific exonuclease RecJ [Cyanobacteria bacterium UBA11149]|nr:single-stranded-DNA-specific exonuclease RecJ [Cyanobacteria bacterium UBA11367]HBE60320.1 single-stranded-DNA-specific exonuclease RecJ [Cyanobacteria bacterium UBA11366]HBK65264.1 single-stranded-DNA-specific exonuclease RecJ [Cyanobacteria bacterium UBA11166]HBR73079.1 single-stranded-DNA-specific exonuclease RecJ [Cyanobacteria bacterium UBA11159]HBS71003.1 single-stranded-DNA-specific exonuclease RecJ [Cyanobacteria bacterium UBA11153]HBW89466.1 single-stranded-DNA-specific exonuclease